MKLYCVSNPEPQHDSHFQKIVVVAQSPAHAKNINPRGEDFREKPEDWDCLGGWPNYPDKVEVRYLGMASGDTGFGEVICVDFKPA